MRLLVYKAAVTLLVTLSAAPSRAGDLATALRALAEGHKGKVAMAVKPLESGESFRYQAEKPMPTASLIKLAVMIEAYQQAEEGRVRLDDLVTLREADKAPGSGILTQHFSAGATFSLRDAVRLMIVYSDNTATNLVLDKIGIGSTAARMEDWGYPNTKIHSKVFRRDTSMFPERSQLFGLGSTTADEMIGLLQELQTGTRIQPEARAAMLDHLKHCDDRDKFPRFLPKGVVLAHKTGSVDRTRTDAGILFTSRGPVALCVLTSDNEDTSWQPDNSGNLLCAKVAQVVYEHFGGVQPGR
jgi:beta-lactamase class A